MAVINVGNTVNGDIPLKIDFFKAQNRHGLILGGSGSGKTYAIQNLCLQYEKAGIPVIIMDYSGSFSPNQVENAIKIMEEDGKLQRTVVYEKGLAINPGIRQMKDPERDLLEKEVDAVLRMKDLLAKALKLTAFQSNIVYGLIKKAYLEYHLEEFQDILEFIVSEIENAQQNPDEGNRCYCNANGANILNKINPFVDQCIFKRCENVFWEQLSKNAITIIDFSYFDISIQQALIEAVLRDLWNYWTRFGNRKDLMILLDEFQVLEFGKGTILEVLLTQGRKFGLNLWLSTQSMAGNFDKRQQNALCQVGTKFYFKPAQEDERMLSNRYGSSVANGLKQLKRGECLMDGTFIGLDGTMRPLQCFVKIPKI